jgi:hypothetical protein
MSELSEGFVTIATMIIGASLLALLVSKQSQTSQVVQSVTNGFSTMLKTALSPIVSSNGLQNYVQ